MRNFFILYSKRINNLTIIILLYSVLLLSKFFTIQIIDKNNIKPIVQSKGTRTITEYGKRGSIYDVNNKELAISFKKYNFWVNTNQPFDRDLIANTFSKELGKSYEYYNNILDKKGKYVRIDKNISYLEAENILKKIDTINGLNKEEVEQRFYPYDFLASQTLGYVDLNNLGITGIEGYFNEILSGDTLKTEIHKGAKGKYYKNINENVRANGNDITLTIDIEFQEILQEELNKIVNKTNAESANGIILNPYNGEIIAMSSVPSFNPNKYYEFDKKNYINKVVSDSYEPGSTFKIIAASSLIDLNIHNDKKEFNCENGETILLNKKKLRDHEPHDNLTMQEIFAHSSNIGMSKIVNDLSEKDFYKYCKLFGFGTKTGISLSNEAKGNLRNLNDWSQTSKTYISIGQELSVTNLQLGMAYCAIANGGYLLKPSIVKTVNNDNEIFNSNKAEILRKIMEEDTATRILQYLENVVEYGTAQNLNLEGYRIGGKTGTAQKFINGSYSKDKFISSFASIFPLEKPKYVLLLSIDSPQYGYHWANLSAVPATKEIIKRIIVIDDDLHSNKSIAISTNQQLKKNHHQENYKYYNKNEDSYIVPNLRGKPLKEALAIANSKGLKLDPNGISGKIVWQSLKAGQKFNDDDICIVKVGI